MPADTIVGDLAAARRVQVPTEGGQTRVAAIDYPFWMALGQRNFDQESPVVAQLETINIASPGHIVKKEDAAIGFEPLITTSEQSGTIPAAMMQGPGPLDPLRLTNSFNPTGEPYVLAARLHGQLKTAFPDGRPQAPATEGAAEGAAARPEEHTSELRSLMRKS